MSDLQSSDSPFEPIPPRKHNPFYVFLALMTAILLFVLSMEGYFYFIRPEPVRAVTLNDVQSFLTAELKKPFSSHRPEKVKEVLEEASPTLKQVANFIVTRSCRKADPLCQSKALFYFVRDEIQYVADPLFHDKLENPLTVLKTGGADCEDMAVLLVGLQKAIGQEGRLVFILGHAYAQVRIADYKDKWLNLEATCDTCDFNEIPTETAIQKKEFYEL